MTPFRDKNRVTSPYGPRVIFGRQEVHRGMDIVPTARAGETLPESAWLVREVTGGTVLRTAADQWRGNYVDVQTAPGTFERYQHLARTDVRAGQAVPQGTVIGLAGSTGQSTGRHLHFGVYRGGAAERCAVVPAAWAGLPNACGTYPGDDRLDAAGGTAAENGLATGTTDGCITEPAGGCAADERPAAAAKGEASASNTASAPPNAADSASGTDSSAADTVPSMSNTASLASDTAPAASDSVSAAPDSLTALFGSSGPDAAGAAMSAAPYSAKNTVPMYILTTQPMTGGDRDTFCAALEALRVRLGVGYAVREV